MSPCMRHATGLANVSGLRSTCTAFCSVQTTAFETDEIEQIRIKAVSILFPLAFSGGRLRRPKAGSMSVLLAMQTRGAGIGGPIAKPRF
jgi:hypothetical protein